MHSQHVHQSTRSTSEMHRLHRTFLHPSHPQRTSHTDQSHVLTSHNFSECPPKSRRQRQQGTKPRTPGDPPSCLTAQLCSHSTAAASQSHHSSVLLHINGLNTTTHTLCQASEPPQHHQKHLWISGVAEGKIKSIFRVIKEAGEEDKSLIVRFLGFVLGVFFAVLLKTLLYF